MCLAIPARVIEKSGGLATVEIEGNRLRADLTMVPDAEVGDYVMLHAGFAISKYSPAEAEETLALLREMRGAGN
jgi:hydrogenase expression/formation protein HypC